MSNHSRILCLPVTEFTDRYLAKALPGEGLPEQFPKLHLTSLGTKREEIEDQFIQKVVATGLIPGFKIVRTFERKSALGFFVYRQDVQADEMDPRFDKLELHIELNGMPKPGGVTDEGHCGAFCGFLGVGCLHGAAPYLRNKTAQCAARWLGCQPRSYAFQILVSYPRAQFIRWDPIGRTVSEPFDVTQDAPHLSRFLWLFTHLWNREREQSLTKYCKSFSESGSSGFCVQQSDIEHPAEMIKRVYSVSKEDGSKLKALECIQERRSSKHDDSAAQKPLCLRVIEDLVRNPFQNFASPRELLQVVYEALIAHQEAYEKCRLIHRDVSSKNVMITPDGRGLLVYWDLASPSFNLPTNETSGRFPRIGTRTFMSAMLLWRRARPPLVQDDIQSFIYLVLYHGLRWGHFGHPRSNFVRGLLDDLFEENKFDFNKPTRAAIKRFNLAENAKKLSDQASAHSKEVDLRRWCAFVFEALKEWHNYELSGLTEKRLDPAPSKELIKAEPKPSTADLTMCEKLRLGTHRALRETWEAVLAVSDTPEDIEPSGKP